MSVKSRTKASKGASSKGTLRRPCDPCWLRLATPDLTTIPEGEQRLDASRCEKRQQGRDMEEDGGEVDGWSWMLEI